MTTQAAPDPTHGRVAWKASYTNVVRRGQVHTWAKASADLAFLNERHGALALPDDDGNEKEVYWLEAVSMDEAPAPAPASAAPDEPAKAVRVLSVAGESDTGRGAS